MSTPVIIGGGPRPTSNIYLVSAVSDDGTTSAIVGYEIRDGAEILANCAKLSHAQALLPLIRSGE